MASSNPCCCLLMFTAIVASLIVASHGARVTPGGDKTLQDQKNFFTFGGTGGYAGVSPAGIPYGGIGGAIGNGGQVGGLPLTGAGGFLGTNPQGQFTGVGGTIPGGVVTIGGNAPNGFGFQPIP